MFSERGFKLVVYEGFKYSKGDKTQSGQKWRCSRRKGCSAHLFTDDAGEILLKTVGVHSHEPCSNLSRNYISNSAKRKASDTLLEPPAKLIRTEIASAPDPVTDNITRDDVTCIRKNLSNAKRRNLPPLPKCAADVHEALDSLHIKTNKGEDMLLLNIATENIVVFCPKSNLEYLVQNDKIFIDGTFTFAAKHFYQFFTIHSVENGNYIPLVFCLLPDKKEATYRSLFEHLIKKCEEMNLTFKPKTVTADFEKAIHNAVESVWPTIEVIGCRFHLSQAWWRKIQEVGLSVEYKSPTSDLGKWLHWVFGLSLLNHEEVGEAYVEDLVPIQPSSSKVDQFVDYLVENYIDNSSEFPPEMWASASLSSERSTNACESFHAKFRKNFNHPHPNIYVFIEAIKNVQIDSYIAIRSAAKPRTILNKYKKRLQYLENLQKKYRSTDPKEKISRFQYIKSVSYQYSQN